MTAPCPSSPLGAGWTDHAGHFRPARLTGETLCTAQDAEWRVPASCFQLTAFAREVELRWLAHPDGGRTAYLAEDATALPAGPARAESFDDMVDQRSVLWGKPEPGESNGFSAWSEGRIGRAHYPCPPGVSPEDRVLLRYREYIRADAHGTMAVAETRQLELTTMGAGGR